MEDNVTYHQGFQLWESPQINRIFLDSEEAQTAF